MDRGGRGTWKLAWSEERANGVPVLVLSGRLGFESASGLKTAIEQARTDPRGLILDLTAVDYLSSASLEVLGQQLRAGFGPVILCGVQDAVRLTLEFSGLLPELSLTPTRGEAAARLAPTNPPEN